jgi:acyl carrier protein
MVLLTSRAGDGNLLAMSAVSRDKLRALMAEVLEVQGKSLPADDAAHLQEIGFRSLDFSELALRVEDEIDYELNFDAAGLRQIFTVGDVLDLLTELQQA